MENASTGVCRAGMLPQDDGVIKVNIVRSFLCIKINNFDFLRKTLSRGHMKGLGNTGSDGVSW